MTESKKRATELPNLKKAEYSFRFEDAQKVEEHFSKAVRNGFAAFNNGFDTYLVNREKSMKDKRFGAVVDFLPNAAEGLSAFLSDSGGVFTELAKSATEFLTFPIPKRKE